jgi:hypothetical protein
MRKIGLFTMTAALILAGVGAWAASTHRTPADTSAGVRLDPSQMMVNAKALPIEDFVDYTFVFN